MNPTAELLDLPPAELIALVRRLHTSHASLKLIALNREGTESELLALFEAGLTGFVPAEATSGGVVDAVDDALQHEIGRLHRLQGRFGQRDRHVGEVVLPLLDRREHEALGVEGRARHHDLQTRHPEQHALDRLRMLRARAPAAPDGRPHHHRHAGLPVVHEMELGGVGHELVHGEQDEIRPVVHEDRTHAVHGRAGRNAHHRFFRQRRVEYPLGAEFFLEAARGAEHRARIVHALPDNHANVPERYAPDGPDADTTPGVYLADTPAAPAVSALGIAAGNTLEALIGAALARRFARGSLAFEEAAPGQVGQVRVHVVEMRLGGGLEGSGLRGHDVLVMDLGIQGDPPFPADVPAAEVARAGGAADTRIHVRRPPRRLGGPRPRSRAGIRRRSW